MARAPPRPQAPAGPPAPAGRQVVVLRAGPPPRRRHRDAIVGILGALILLLAIVLPGISGVLWEETILPPQYRVTYVDVTTDLPQQQAYINESKAVHHFLFNVTEDNVHSIVIAVHFEDDIPASEPDRFTIELWSPEPNPNLILPAEVIMNEPAVANASDPTAYEPQTKQRSLSISLLPKPDDKIVQRDLNSTAEGVAAEEARLAFFSTQGTWKVTVKLVNAGDCPTPGTNPDTDLALRAAACRQSNAAVGAAADKDPGNPFTVGSFSYTRFTVNAERL